MREIPTELRDRRCLVVSRPCQNPYCDMHIDVVNVDRSECSTCGAVYIPSGPPKFTDVSTYVQQPMIMFLDDMVYGPVVSSWRM